MPSKPSSARPLAERGRGPQVGRLRRRAPGRLRRGSRCRGCQPRRRALPRHPLCARLLARRDVHSVVARAGPVERAKAGRRAVRKQRSRVEVLAAGGGGDLLRLDARTRWKPSSCACSSASAANSATNRTGCKPGSPAPSRALPRFATRSGPTRWSTSRPRAIRN